jgi:hypothetical protein
VTDELRVLGDVNLGSSREAVRVRPSGSRSITLYARAGAFHRMPNKVIQCASGVRVTGTFEPHIIR